MPILRRLLIPSLASALMLMPAIADTPNQTQKETLEQLEIFASVLATIQQEYVEETDDQKLIEHAINGALEGLDPHSHYLAPVEYEERQETVKREYGGLGIEVIQENGLVKILYVTPNGPAFKAGLKRDDLITSVEGVSVIGKSLDEAVEGMRGLAGDPITVSVQSGSGYVRDVVVTREVVQGRAVRHRNEDGMAYIYIETFNHPRLKEDVEYALKDLTTTFGGTLPGLIIDVRSNPGGLVDQVVDVTGYFLDGGEVFSAKGRTLADTERFNTKSGELVASDTPIVVLINSQSASAAEIIAGAIQDRNRGLVMGRRSFGKGSVQTVFPMDDGGALRLTTQRYYTPSGASIQSRGIIPDILVSARPDTGDNRKFFRESSLRNALSNGKAEAYEEDPDDILYPPSNWPRNDDFQIDQAVELLKSSRYSQLLANRNSQ